MNEEKAKTVDIGFLPPDTPDEVVEGIMVADNNLSAKAVDNEELLAMLLQEQQDAGYDLASLGSDDEALRQMLASLGDGYLGSDESETEEDATPEVEEEQTRVKLGDIWKLGRHRLGVFDCYDVGLMKKLLEGESVQAIVSDPPYGMKLDAAYTFSKGNADMSIKPSRGYSNVIGDDKAFDASVLFSMFPNVKEVFLCGADYYVDTLPNYGKGGAWMVWDKKNEALRNVLGLADFELIWSMQRHKRRVYAILWNGALGTESEDTKRRVHPTQKPVRLLEAIMSEYVKPDMLVADPFLGSGSTLVACQNLGYRCVGVEVHPPYANVIISRWEQLTGQQAQLLERVEVPAHA